MDMFEFDRALGRLKQAVGVRTNKDLAPFLGLKESALSKRKRRGAFPVDDLKALASARPDLAIDVDHVLGVKNTTTDDVPSFIRGMAHRLQMIRGERSIEDFAAVVGLGADQLREIDSAARLPTPQELVSLLRADTGHDPYWLVTGSARPAPSKLAPDEISLIEHYRQSGRVGRELILRLAIQASVLEIERGTEL